MSDSEEKKSATCSAESEMADSDRYYDTGSAVNSRSSSFSSGPGGLRGSHSDTRLYERTRALRRNSSSSMSCVEASDSSSIHDSDKVHFLVKKYPWRTQWRSLDNVSSSCSSRSSVLDEDLSKSHWKPPKSTFRDLLPQEETSHNHHLQVKYGSFKEVDEETEELKGGPSNDWSSHCLITPKPIHLARISDTESDKNTYSPPPYLGRLRDVEYELSLSKSSQYVPSRLTSSVTRSYKNQSSFEASSCPTTYQSSGIRSSINTDYDSYGDRNVSYKSATEGSMESLDKYETAIRDEELTVSDEKSSGNLPSYQKIKGMETFSEFEKDLRQRAAKGALSGSNACSTSHQSISDYIDREKQSSHPACSSISEYSSTQPGSPNISKYKYKGTKGFGHSPRKEFVKNEDSDKLTLTQLQASQNDDEAGESTRVDI